MYSETKPKPVANNNELESGWYECPSKTQIRLRIRAVWSESSMVALWVATGSTFLQAKNQRSDQIVRMCNLVLILAVRIC